MDWNAEGLLDGLDADERRAREALLDRLHEQGITVDELRGAVSEDRLVLLPLERQLGGQYTAAEVQEKTGIPAELLLRIRRLSGLPEPAAGDRVFGEEDLEVGRSTQLFLQAGLTEESISEMTRVLGEAMARVAATTGAHFVEAFLRPGDSEVDLAERFEKLAEKLIPALEPVLVAALKAHLREAVRRGMIGREDRLVGYVDQGQPLAVCFADVVGFTRLGAEVDVEELGHVAACLAELAAEVTEPPVRLVKTIGDAAMFVSSDPGPLVGVSLALVERIELAELPPLRAGIAFGRALQRSGDVFGHSVNLASRVTGIARPGSVLVTQEVRDAAPEDYEWSFAGKHRLKGLKELQSLHRARPRSSPEG
ncbi:MAG TPA: adenylate cyclase regulatory domain-containing protein [Solirubrobacteraceae bacterium]|nr:adenylate cyclase regulatory domain-containing protein [Solirubrobacteraceae bacterium]